MSFFKKYPNRTNINEIFFNMMYDEIYKYIDTDITKRRLYFKNYYQKNKKKYKK